MLIVSSWQERESLMQTCVTMCYLDLKKTNNTVTKWLNKQDLSFNKNSYKRTFKCLVMF